MKRLILGGVLLACVSLSAQTMIPGPGEPRPPFAIRSTIDSPSPYMPQPYAPGFTIMGWAFDCRSGAQPPYVAVLDHHMGTHAVKWITRYTVNRAVVRPDVQATFGAGCPGLVTGLGYEVTVNEPLVSGRHFLTVFWTTGDGLSRSEGVGVDVP